MLVLTRKSGQSIVISDNIEVTILEVKGDSIKLGIQAPKSVTVYRQEIYEAIKRENQKTAHESSLEDVSKLFDMFQDMPKPKRKSDYTIHLNRKNDK